jgi:VWFA-related protein
LIGPSRFLLAKAAIQNEERRAEAASSPNRDDPFPVPQSPPGHLPEFQLRVERNLVMVRAVVRNSEGKPIENLTKEDFRVFDRGKEQPIGQFEAVNIPPEPAARSSSPEGRIEKQSIAADARRQTFLALYFDDLNTSGMNMVQARDAAESFLTEFPRNERVGLFTSDGMLADFTGNTKVLHDGLAKLHASPRVFKRIREMSRFVRLPGTANCRFRKSDNRRLESRPRRSRPSMWHPRPSGAGLTLARGKYGKQTLSGD